MRKQNKAGGYSQTVIAVFTVIDWKGKNHGR